MADINVIVLPDGTEYPVSDYYLPVAISNPTDGQVLKYDATNHVWYNGEDTSGSSILYGTSAPTSQLGTDGCLYVKYTEGTGGASDTVDALYVKLDGAWCQISTGGGGGASSADQVSVDDTDLEYEADDVQEALEKIYKRITLAEYEQLSQAEKYNGTIYFITDVKGANQTLTKEITDTAIATFDTDRAERLVNLEVAITATGGGGTPVSPIAINGFSACNLSVNGTTETITFGQTVYGGRLNVGSGVLNVTHRIVDLGTLTWNTITSSGYLLFFSNGLGSVIKPPASNLTLANVISDIYSVVTADGASGVDFTDNSIAVTTTKTVYIHNLAYTDATTFKTAMSGHCMVYELATPIEIQLDSKQIQAIIGTNNIYADTGDIIDLKFILSVGQAIS